MIVVSDTSPILNLARINQIDLLRTLYVQVLVPPAVHSELARSLATDPQQYASISWLSVETPHDNALIAKLRAQLHIGEAEAIALALEHKADLLLVDEKLGREVARRLGLRITGLLGVLVEAKHAGLVQRVKPVLDELISGAHFWMTSELYREVLVTVGEL